MKNYWACQEKQLAATHSRVRRDNSYREHHEGWLGFMGRWGGAMWKMAMSEWSPTDPWGGELARPRVLRGLCWSYYVRLTVSRWRRHKHQIWVQMSQKWNQWGKVMRGALFNWEETWVEKRRDEGRWGRTSVGQWREEGIKGTGCTEASWWPACLSSKALRLITSLSYLLIKL